MFYVNFINLCADKSVTPAQVGREIGVSGAAISKWKAGGMPSDTTLAKVANYFGVTTDYLLTGEIKKSPASELTEDDELNEYLNVLKNNPGMRTLFSKTKSASQEDLDKVIAMIDIMRGNTYGGYYI